MADEDQTRSTIDALLLRAREAWLDDGVKAALPALLEGLELDTDDPDLRHTLGLAYEELGDHGEMVRHFMQTRLIDARDDRRAGIGTPEELDFIAEVAAAALERLPREWLERLDGIAIMMAPRPAMQLVREGFDPRAYGVFHGAGLLDMEAVVETPPHILLFTSNLLADFADPEQLAEQVEITVLHEVAHYFGFEEDEMRALGLE